MPWTGRGGSGASQVRQACKRSPPGRTPYVDGTLHPNRGFTLRLQAAFRPENVPGSAQTQVIAIDRQGDTGGFYIDAAGATHGFLRVKGRFQRVDRPGTPFNQILGLNNRGQAAGYDQDFGRRYLSDERRSGGRLLRHGQSARHGAPDGEYDLLPHDRR